LQRIRENLFAPQAASSMQPMGPKAARSCVIFSTSAKSFMDDAALTRRIAIEKLEAKPTELHLQWAWIKAVLDPDYHFMAERAPVAGRPPTRTGSRDRAHRAELQEVSEYD
jgi:hypothetical protein